MVGLEVHLIVALSLLFAAWYGLGSWVNARYKARILRRLADALGADLAGRARYTSLGSSGFVLEATGKGGYPRLAVAVLLGKREVPIAWLIDYALGRRDRFELVADVLGGCGDCACFNLFSYWGRLIHGKSRTRLEGGPCTCREGAEKWGPILDKVYYVKASPGKGVCRLNIIGDPHRLHEVVSFILH